MIPVLVTMIFGLFLGMIAGAIMQRSDFCMTAAFRDFFLFRSTTMLSALLLLVTVSAVLFELVRLLTGAQPFALPAFGVPSLVTVFGGGIFGIGMVLAGGCVVGTLYRLGAGSRLALWALVGMIAGSALYAEIHPFWSDLKGMATLGQQAVTLPQWSGLPLWPFILVLVLVTGTLLWRWPKAFAPLPGWRELDGYIPPPYAALALAGVGTLSVILYGKPLGVTTSYAKAAAYLELLLVPGHLSATPFFQTQMPIVFPFVPGTLSAGPGPSFDGIAVLQYPLILGIILGSAVSAWHLDEWRWSRGAPWPQTVSALLGGILMGLAARLATGCNIWHLWGGLPVFSVQSYLFLLGLLPGAWLGGRLLVRWVLPEKSKEMIHE
ncbi:MAG: hypothetical protein CVU69_09335 [Deltaproteobacteria bacterium HGW-Deltaproteobacteria-4]|nr:MAG: hypothetical protein CVU69_09335 [Deltaproteobacteria bacterium HGW-Deltaproteobacteria-4]